MIRVWSDMANGKRQTANVKPMEKLLLDPCHAHSECQL
jgi:hypothetical protein